MTRALVVVLSCEECGAQFSPEDEGTVSLNFVVENKSNFEIDLCAEHGKVWTTMVDLARYMPAAAVKKPETQQKPHACPHCDKTYASPNGLKGHIKKKHDEPGEPGEPFDSADPFEGLS